MRSPPRFVLEPVEALPPAGIVKAMEARYGRAAMEAWRAARAVAAARRRCEREARPEARFARVQVRIQGTEEHEDHEG